MMIAKVAENVVIFNFDPVIFNPLTYPGDEILNNLNFSSGSQSHFLKAKGPFELDY